MPRADRRHPAIRRPLGSHNSRLTREQLDEPRLALLYGRARIGQGELLHAGIAKGPRPGRTLCSDVTLFQHPLFARDPRFGPGLGAEERHLYALWALRVNHGSSCHACEEQLVLSGGDGIYPYLNPDKAMPL